MEANKTLRVAVAGCGSITRLRHAPEYAANPRAEIMGFYDLNPARAGELAEKFGGKVYDSFDSLLAAPDVDAVSVCTPNFLHGPNTIQALRAGKHVLCEKPMASTIEEAEEMMAVQRETGRILMLGHNQRLVKTHIRAKELLDGGCIGSVLSVQTSFKHKGPEIWSVEKSGSWFFSRGKAGFGVLGDLGAHKIDLIRYLLGDEIQQIFAWLTTQDKRTPDGQLIDLEDNAVCLFRTVRGIPGSMSVSWTDYGPEDNSTIIYGTKGTMTVFGRHMDDIVVELSDSTSSRYHVSPMSTNDHQLASGVIDAFVDAALSGSEPPVTGLDGRNALAVLEAARVSSDTRAWAQVRLK